MLIGSVANGLYSCGGFCAGSQIVVKHQVWVFMLIISSLLNMNFFFFLETV